MRKNYQSKARKSNHKFEVVRGQELLVQVPLPMAEVWAEMQAQVEELNGQVGLQILRAILGNEVTRRVGPPHRPDPTAGCAAELWSSCAECPGGLRDREEKREPAIRDCQQQSVAATGRAAFCIAMIVRYGKGELRGQRAPSQYFYEI